MGFKKKLSIFVSICSISSTKLENRKICQIGAIFNKGNKLSYVLYLTLKNVFATALHFLIWWLKFFSRIFKSSNIYYSYLKIKTQITLINVQYFSWPINEINYNSPVNYVLIMFYYNVKLSHSLAQ